MKFIPKPLFSSARLAVGLLLASIVLSACGAGDDGPVMSDEEKLKTFDKGHNAYGNGGGAPGAASGATGAPSAPQ